MILRRHTVSLAVLAISILAISAHGMKNAGPPSGDTPKALAGLSDLLSRLERDRIPTGILYDRVVPLSRIAEHNGDEESPPATLRHWKQMLFEMSVASLDEPAWPSAREIAEIVNRSVRNGAIPVAVMNIEYNAIRPGALEDGTLEIVGDRLVETGPNPYVEKRVFAAAVLKDYTFRGETVVFALERRLYLTNDAAAPRRVEVDFDDGIGFRSIGFGDGHTVHYHTTGRKTIRMRITLADGTRVHSRSYFRVERLQTPSPDDTLDVAATIPYDGEAGTGEAYVYLSDSHTSITNPVVIIEGFDLDNTYNWDELYELLNQENLLETLRASGFDAVILNFTDATDYLQRNSFVVVELLQMIQSYLAPHRDMALVGGSMGALCARYGLAYMETEGIEHKVRTLISFDGPQSGANIPLGVQYWLVFFSGLSEDAAFLLDRLDRPASKQMLVHHHTDPPGGTGEADSLRVDMLADFAVVGEYPSGVRKVAIANGSGYGADQGFAPGDQIIDYSYGSLFVNIIGDVWAVPDVTNQIIFDGLIDIIFFPDEQMSVYVSGTRPYDNAPGGSRNSMAQMDSTEAPYGDIVAIHPEHCFVPTVSALDLTTEDLFYDIAGDPDLLMLTPFDVVYYPVENQGHMTITSETADWFISEIEEGITSVGPDTPVMSHMRLVPPFPNPASTEALIGFTLDRTGPVTVTLHDVKGRRVATLLDGDLRPAGAGVISLDVSHLASGVYFVRMNGPTGNVSRKLAVIR